MRRTRGTGLAPFALPCGLALAALGGLLSNSWLVLAALLLPACLLAGALLFLTVFREEFRLGRLLGSVTTLWYFTPVIVAAAPGSTFQLPSSLASTATSAALIAASIAAMLLAEQYFMRRVFVVRAEDDADLAAGGLFLAVATAVLVALMATGQWTFSAGRATGELAPHLMVAAAVANIAAPLAARLLGAQLLDARRSNFLLPLVLIAAMLSSLGWQMVGGRRAFALSVGLTAVSFAAVYWRRALTIKRLVIAAVVIVALAAPVSSAWRLFFAVRVANYAVAHGQRPPSMLEAVRATQHLDRRVVEGAFSENVRSRGLIINSVNLFHETSRGALLGRGVYVSVLNAVPAALFPGKAQWERTNPTTETLWYQVLSVPLTDHATTLFLDSYADFGVAGLTVYALLVFGMIYGFMAIAAHVPNGRLVVLIQFTMMILYAEDSFAAFLAGARNLLLVLVAMAICARLFGGSRQGAWPAMGPLPVRSGTAGPGRRL